MKSTRLSIFRRIPGHLGRSLVDVGASRRRRAAIALDVQGLEGRQMLSTFTVTTNTDHGAGSFRQAIVAADAATTPSTIDFQIGTGAQPITLTTALPPIGSRVTIDGTSQPGYAGIPLITLYGNKLGGAVEGLTIAGNGSSVTGLAIAQFPGDGILIEGDGNTIASDNIGLRGTGSAAGNGGSGIIIRNGSHNTIGSATGTGGDVISSNGWRGVWIDGSTSSGNLVEGDRIGTNDIGTLALPNGGDGVSVVNAPNNTIGGTAPGAGDLISGNGRVGIWIDGTTASGNLVEGDKIGTSLSGTWAIGNGLSGVMTEGAPGNIIGGTAPGSGDLISGNLLRGVWLDGGGSAGNQVLGDEIGTSVSGTDAIPNAGDGISVVNAPGNTIGGTAPGAGDLISGNGRVGIWIDGTGSAGNLVEGDKIGTNLAGTQGLTNGLSAVMMVDALDNTIGGLATGAGNLIVGNSTWVPLFDGMGSQGDVTLGNRVGTASSGGQLVFTASQIVVHAEGKNAHL